MIIYLHGFNSSPMSEKARQTAAFCADRDIACIVPQLYHRPAEAIAGVRQLLDESIERTAENRRRLLRDSLENNYSHRALAIAQEQHNVAANLTVIGSSMGGYYAAYLCQHYADLRAVLINPAVKLADKLAGEVGKLQKNYHNGEEYLFTKEHLDEFAALDVPKLHNPARCLLMVQTGDEVLDYREAVEYYAGARQIVEDGGDHSFAGFAKHLPELLDFHKTGNIGV